MSGLEGKVALITGAGGMRGIGRATALKLAALGIDLALTDVLRDVDDLPPGEIRAEWKSVDSVSEEVRQFGRKCLPIYADLGDSKQIESVVKQTVDHFGHIDIMINNARAIIGRDRVPVTELDEGVWHNFLDINTTAPFLFTKFAGREMVRQGSGGRIINMASNASKQASATGSAYSASKFAVLGLTQASALDLAPYQITVNAVCPGSTNTDRTDYSERGVAESEGVSVEEVRARVVAEAARRSPLGRMGESEDVANLVAFLVSDEASFITGQAYNVNGGILFH
jgi:3-oxoacyl-[acyl-carrier protein] reductase/meso-butanediol dehydrogenase/(S,S)-butanediol dehydrogenase/diacetyl reductase